MKRWVSKGFDLLFYALILFILGTRAPSIWDHFSREGSQIITPFRLQTSQQVFDSEKPHTKMALIFWATWCGPCQIELARINEMIVNGDIAPEDVLAISSFEDEDLIRDVVLKRGYKFTVGLDSSGKVAKIFNITGTPTVVLLDEQNRIQWMTTGLSPSLGFRLKNFIKFKLAP